MNWTQKTLRKDIECAGIGLHSGVRVAMRLRPGAPNSGIVFRRMDLGGAEIPALQEHLQRSKLATTLAKGAASTGTVEHPLAPASGLPSHPLSDAVEGNSSSVALAVSTATTGRPSRR